MLRQAVRRLLASPAFTATAVALLAMSIGAAASIGGLLEAVMLRPLPFRDAERLVWIWASRVDRDKAFFSVPEFLDHIAATQGADLVACAQWDTTLSGLGEPERVQGARMAVNGMTALGFSPAAGRVFDSGDEQRRVVVLSHDLWRRRFGADPRAVGQTLTLNGDPYEIVGVLPPEWILPNFEAQVWVPFDLRADPRRGQRGNNFIRAFGRLRPGATRESVQAELKATQQRLKAEYADAIKTAPPRVYRFIDELVGAVRRPLWLLAGGVALLILAACANLAGLLLARGASRRGEFAVRAALGARPLQLAREVLLETGLVAAAGGLLGIGLANWLIAVLVRLGPRDLPRASHAGVDPWVAAGALVISALAALAAALPPALQAGLGDAREALAEGTGSRSTARARRVAVLVEVALTALLLTVAGLVGRGFVRLQGTEPGFRPEGVLTARISLPREGYANAVDVQRFAERLLSRLETLPGAQRAGIGQVLPLTGLNVRADFAVVGRPPLTAADAPAAQTRWSSPGWIGALGIPLLSGRDFDAGDDARGRKVAIADAALVRKYLSGLNPVGTHLVFDDGRDVEIVGVVGEVRHFALDEQPLPTLYMPVAQLAPDVVPYFTSRSFVALRAPGLAPSALREAIRDVDANVAADVRPFGEVVGAALAPRKFQTLVMGLFAGAALVLAATGLYGLLAWSVMQRRREIGVRLALGATANRVVRMVVGEGLRLSLAGLAVGAVLSVGAARALPAIVPDILAADAASFIGAPLVLIAVALASSWIAARRAGALDPMHALRTG
jgi:predicted permease